MNMIDVKYSVSAESRTMNPARHGLGCLCLLGCSRFLRTHTPTEAHIHRDMMEIGFCTRASLRLNVAGQEHPIMPGDFFINQPNVLHHLTSSPAGVVIHYLMLRSPSRETLLGLPAAESSALWRRLSHLPPTVSASHVEQRVLKAFTALMQLCALAKSPITSVRMRQQALSLILLLLDQSQANLSGRDIGSITQIAEAIRAHPERPFVLSELARNASLSQNHFINLFRRATGLPPAKFQTECRICRAKELLSRTRLPILDIALQLGFFSHQHFSATFTRLVGTSPSHWRLSFTVKGEH